MTYITEKSFLGAGFLKHRLEVPWAGSVVNSQSGSKELCLQSNTLRNGDLLAENTVSTPVFGGHKPGFPMRAMVQYLLTQRLT